MKRKFLISTLCMATVLTMLSGCTLQKPETRTTGHTQTAVPIQAAVVETTEPAAQAEQMSAPTAEPPQAPTEEPALPETPDGQGVVQFTIVLHLEGWDDGDKEVSFRRHASQLREYADLFERYGAKMTLESKEIIDGCINWNDNVLLELQGRGHAVGIHADAGGEKNASVRSIERTLEEMRAKLALLGVDASFASGVASKADWVEACRRAQIDTVSCMVAYGLWSLDPALRPDGFEAYKNPGDGHEPYPFLLEERVHPWLMGSGANWIVPDETGDVLIIPTGLSLNAASDELNGSSVMQSDFTRDDIDAWREALSRVVAASDSGRVNTFYAVWSFGKAVDEDLLEEWLQLVDSYVQAGSIRWSTIPEMARLYRAAAD